MKRFLNWFDVEDGLELTLTFLLSLPFCFLFLPPLAAAQLGNTEWFLSGSIVGWVALPALTYMITALAYTNRAHRPGFVSLFLWIGMTLSTTLLWAFLTESFWVQGKLGWSALMLVVDLVLVNETVRRFQRRAAPK